MQPNQTEKSNETNREKSGLLPKIKSELSELQVYLCGCCFASLIFCLFLPHSQWPFYYYVKCDLIRHNFKCVHKTKQFRLHNFWNVWYDKSSLYMTSLWLGQLNVFCCCFVSIFCCLETEALYSRAAEAAHIFSRLKFHNFWCGIEMLFWSVATANCF